MTPSPRLRTAAWLLRGISSLPGVLSLANNRLTFTAFGSGNFWPGQLRQLEADTGRAQLAQRLESDQRSILLDVPLDEVEAIRFPWYYFSGGVKLTVGGVRYRFGFDRPANTMPSHDVVGNINEITRGRQSGKAWRKALGRR